MNCRLQFALSLPGLLICSAETWAQDQSPVVPPVKINVETPRLLVPDFPEPPRQRQHWEHPDNPVANAAAILFEKYGLPDPRGCEYREVVVNQAAPNFIGQYTNTSLRASNPYVFWPADASRTREFDVFTEKPYKDHAWIIPSDQGPFYAIGWDGLIYPVLEMGAPVSLQADVEALLENAKRRTSTRFYEFVRTPTTFSQGKPIQIAMLFRLGLSGSGEELTRYLQVQERPLVSMGENWLKNQSSRAVAEHLRGDVRGAYLDLERRKRIYPGLVSEMNASLPPERRELSSYNRSMPWPGFQQLQPNSDPLEPLLTDVRRRMVERGQAKKLEGLQKLIHELEDVSLENYDDKLEPHFINDGRVKAIINYGEGAIEPLLDVVKNDSRLTRTTVNSGGYWPVTGTNIATVRSVALEAVNEILGTKFGRFPRDLDKPDTITQIRDFWSKTKSLSREERWVFALRDDKAGPETWLAMASNIVGEKRRVLDNSRTMSASPGEPKGMMASSLKRLSSPSVSDLMAKRSDGMAARSREDFTQTYSQYSATEMALYMEKWDAPAAKSTLSARLKELVELQSLPASHHFNGVNTNIGRLVPQCVQALDRAGSKEGWPILADWLKVVDLTEIFAGYELQSILPELAAKDPGVENSLIWLLNDPKAPFYSLTQPGPMKAYDVAKSPLAKTKAFLLQAKRGFDDLTPLGTVIVEAKSNQGKRQITISWNNLHEGSSAPEGSPGLPDGKETLTLRVRDYYAWALSTNYPEAPRFERYWPEAQRDEAISALRKWVAERLK